MLTGPDVSRWQGSVDWQAVRRHGHDFAILKATDGIRYGYTSWFHNNFPKAKAAGLIPGAYHFLLAHYNGADQARFYVNTVGRFDGVLAVVDVETGADGARPSITRVREFAAEFKRLVPNHPLIVYTGKWYWDGIMGNPRGSDIGPLWHSEYDTGSEVADGPELDSYGGWANATIWQYTSTGRCPGVNGNCDLNLFYGDLNDMRRLTNVQEDDDMNTAEFRAELSKALADNDPIAERLQARVREAIEAELTEWGGEFRSAVRSIVKEELAKAGQ